MARQCRQSFRIHLVELSLVVCLTWLVFIYYRPCPTTVEPPKKSPVRIGPAGVVHGGLSTAPHGENILCIFSGRWSFLRVSFPYLYRDLRRHGGVLDKVYYIMMQYDDQTNDNLHDLVRAANALLKEEVFQFRYLNSLEDKRNRHPGAFAEFYYIIFDELARHPLNKYFKMDDDIVYIHPGTFRSMIEQQDPDRCFIHFGNIVSNWRCNFIHQELGIFDREVNPKNLRFGFSPHAECGWKSPECASLALRAFLHNYRRGSLDRYLFPGLKLTPDRSRFSINFMLMDISLIDLKRLLELGPIGDDEKWWTQLYSANVPNPNCIVGSAFVVHFSYYTTFVDMMKLDLLAEFEAIVRNEFNDVLPERLNAVLKFS